MPERQSAEKQLIVLGKVTFDGECDIPVVSHSDCLCAHGHIKDLVVKIVS